MTPQAFAAMTWPKAATLVAMMAFSAFVLWLTATTFDASEVKSLLMLSAGFVVREVLPLVMKALGHTTEAFGRGGQVE